MSTQMADLLATYKTPEGGFDVALTGDLSIHFRHPLDATEYLMIGQAAAKFGRMVSDGTVPQEWKQYTPLDRRVAEMCYWLHALAQEPAISQPEALQMAKECGALVPFVYTQLGEALAGRYIRAEVEAIDGLGEPSPSTE